MKLSNIFTNILALSSIALTVACNEEPSMEFRTINAVIEQQDTRTALEGPDANEVYKTVWTSGDEIAVYSGESTAKQFKLKSGENTNKGVFEGAAEQGNLVAVYPYSIAKVGSGSTVSVYLPEVQEYMKGNIPKGAYPMVASSDNDTFSFKNLCSVLKVSMFGDATVKSIIFTPAKDGVGVAGNASIKVDSKELVMADDAIPSIKLSCPDVKLSDTALDFHIVVPAQEYPGGFTITINTDKGDVIKSLKSYITLSRSVLYPIEAFECKVSNAITFKDANFKAYMIANFDTDNDGEISFDEALNVTKIDVSTHNIESLSGIEYMTNLTDLTCRGDKFWNNSTGMYNDGILSSLDVSKNTKLRVLNCRKNKLESIDVSNNLELDSLSCYSNNISSIDVSKNTKLKELYLSHNKKISSIDVSKNTELKKLDCGYNKLTSLDVRNNPKLISLNFYNNSISQIDISNNPELEYLYCIINNLTELDLSNNNKLRYLYFESNKLESIDLKHCPDLELISGKNNKIKSMNVNCCPKLESINVSMNSIETLDISEISGLNYLNCGNNPLQTLYVYNGQLEAITEKTIPTTTSIVVIGTEDPSAWAGKTFWHKSLGLKFTATWCGFCPRMATSFSLAQKQLPNKIEVMNVHGYDSNYYYAAASSIISYFGVSGYPTGIIDYRRKVDNTSSEIGCSDVVTFVKETEENYPTTTGISFNSSVSENTLNLEIKLYIKDKGDYKLTAALLENNVVGSQTGGSSSYVHNHITRLAITSITGDSFSTTSNNRTISKKYNVTIPSGCNKENLSILVFVLKPYGIQTVLQSGNYGDYYVDNAISAPIGTSQELVFSDGSVFGGNEDTKDGGEITLK